MLTNKLCVLSDTSSSDVVPAWTRPPVLPEPAPLITTGLFDLPPSDPTHYRALLLFQTIAVEAAHFSFPLILPGPTSIPILPPSLFVHHYLRPAMRNTEWWSGVMPTPATPAQLLMLYGRELRYWESHNLCSYILSLPPTAVKAHNVNEFFIHFNRMEAYICFGTPSPAEQQLVPANTPDGRLRRFDQMAKYFPMEFLLLMDWSPFDALRSASEIELAASPSASTLRHSRNTFGILCSIPEPNPSLVEATGRTLYSLASDILMNSFLNAQRIDVAAALQKQGLLYVSQIDDAQRLLNPSSLLMPTPAELDIEGKSAVIASLRDWLPRISNWPPTQPPFIWSKCFGCLPRLFYFAGIVQHLVLQDLDRLLHTFLTLFDVHKSVLDLEDPSKVGRPLPLISTLSEPHVVCSEMDPVAPSIVPSPSILEIASHSPTGPVVAKTGLAVHLDLDNLSASVP